MWMFGGVSTGTLGKEARRSGRRVSWSRRGGCPGHAGTERPGNPELRQRAAQGTGQRAREKINCLVFHNSEEFGVSIWGLPFPGRGGVSCSCPPHPLQCRLMYLTHGGSGKEAAHRHSLCESRLGPDQGRQGGCSQAPRARARGQAPDPRSAFLLTKVAVQVNPTGYTDPKTH